MPDMLVNLEKLPGCDTGKLEKEGIRIIRAMTPNMFQVLDFVKQTMGERAMGEAAVCFSHQPVSLFIAVKDDKIIGFACYNATLKDYFGPTEVLEEYRGQGIGKALLLKCLESLKADGYAYAIIGGVGPVDFYYKCCGATVIPDTDPGIYKDML